MDEAPSTTVKLADHDQVPRSRTAIQVFWKHCVSILRVLRVLKTMTVHLAIATRGSFFKLDLSKPGSVAGNLEAAGAHMIK